MVQQRLRGLAKDNSIYIVVNIGDKKPCNASDPQSPPHPSSHYQDNSGVVSDSKGRLMACYHKVRVSSFVCDKYVHSFVVMSVFLSYFIFLKNLYLFETERDKMSWGEG